MKEFQDLRKLAESASDPLEDADCAEVEDPSMGKGSRREHTGPHPHGRGKGARRRECMVGCGEGHLSGKKLTQ